MKILNFNTLIEIKKLNIKFKKRRLIENINLEIKKGDIVTITGENGSGKTTLINYLIGIKQSQNVKISKDAKISFSPQTAFFTGKISSILEKYATMLNDYSILEKVKKSFSLEQIWSSNYENVSSGEQQRIKLAISFLRKPNLIVLDEFTRGLDEMAINGFIKLIKNLNKKLNISIIIISHNKKIIKELSSKHYHISDGKIREVSNVKK